MQSLGASIAIVRELDLYGSIQDKMNKRGIPIHTRSMAESEFRCFSMSVDPLIKRLQKEVNTYLTKILTIRDSRVDSAVVEKTPYTAERCRPFE